MDHCIEIRVNRRVPDFNCVFEKGHGGCHKMANGFGWAHPGRKGGFVPYGVRRDRSRNSGHGSKTKPKTWWSAAPAFGYKPTP